MGADTMRSAIAALVPKAQFLKRERFSDLTYTGSKKISRMKPRSAIVGFSVDQVYAMAELIRRQRGGCAVVMGALSPRTRNAQVDLYQNGDVDFLVATDAIGMGLNLDLTHVAFSATSNLTDAYPPLHPMRWPDRRAAERYTTPGTFGVTGEARLYRMNMWRPFRTVFTPIKRLQWRNDKLPSDLKASVASLETLGSEDNRSEYCGRVRPTIRWRSNRFGGSRGRGPAFDAQGCSTALGCLPNSGFPRDISR